MVSRINISITVRSDESGPKLFRSKDLGATGGLSAKATHAADRRTGGGCEEKQTQVTAVEFKDQGNRFYALHKYEDAIACYSRAIVSPFNCCGLS